MAIQNLVVNDYFSTPNSTTYYTQWVSGGSDYRNLLATIGGDMFGGFNDTSGSDQTVEYFNNGLLKITATAHYVSGHFELRYFGFYNLQTGRYFGVSNTNYAYSMYICLGYDDAVQKAYFFTVGRFYYNGAWEQKDYGTLGGNAQEQLELYQAVSGSVLPLYNWSSVPAISGKNGILLPMSTLNDINDGNEVTTSDTSKFNLNDSSNIKSLVDAVVNDF